MILGFDANEANSMSRVGVGWYAYYLIHELAARAGSGLEIRIFLKTAPLSDLPKETVHFKYIVVPKRTVWSQIDLPVALILNHRDLDIFLSPAHYAPRFCPCPTVVVVHDLSYFYYPQDFLKKDLYQLVNWTRYSVQKAQKIIAVSEVTKEDIVKNYPVNNEKVVVVQNGFSVPKIKAEQPGFEIKHPYFLYLGTLQPRKNLQNLLLAFARFQSRYPDFSLYLVGKKGWLFEGILDLIQKLQLTNAVIVTEYLKDSEKNYLLKHARALLAPGFYEGFGLPILEGFAAQVPVLSSNTGALPEVAGEGALYFNPTKVSEIVDCMTKITEQKALGSSLQKKAEKKLKEFSWEKTTDQILKVLNEVVA